MIDRDIRLLAVERFKILDLEEDAEFQELVEMATNICDTPIALITLIDRDVQWLRVRKGTDVKEMPSEAAFCTYTIQDDTVLMIPDLTKDERFKNYPTVTNDPNIRFYAGAPLITSDGYRVGSLCVVDTKPNQLNKHQQMMLQMLSRQAINLMEFRISVEMLEKNKIEFEEQREIISKAEIKLRSFFESSSNFQVLLDKNCKVIDYNRVAYNFIKKINHTKLTRGSHFMAFLPPDVVNKFTKSFNTALKGKHSLTEGFTDYGAHGTIHWEASFATAKDMNNKIIGVSYIISDVTDRKIKEQKILFQNQSLIKIAHLQAHQFRAPLTTVIGMIELIKAEDYNAPKKYYELLETAVHNLDEKICEIVNSIDNTAF